MRLQDPNENSDPINDLFCELLIDLPAASAQLRGAPLTRIRKGLESPTLRQEEVPPASAALLLAAEGLEALGSLQDRLESLEACAEAVAGARQRWRFLAWVRSEVLFMSDAGEVASLPKALAWRLHARQTLDVGYEVAGHCLVFRSAGKEVARLPRGMLPGLLGLLAEVPWDDPLQALGEAGSTRSDAAPGSVPSS